MNELEYMFEEEEQIVLADVNPNEPFSAVRLLTELEASGEETLKAVMDAMTDNGITLDISALPKAHGVGEAAERLRLEKQLAKSDNLIEQLQETDPLRLYLEEIAGLPVSGDPDVLAKKLTKEDEPGAYRLADLMFSRIIQLAKEYVGRGVLLMDLIQEASLGLWQAIQTYRDGDKTQSFREYCDWWLHQYLAEAVIMQAKVTGVGEKLHRAAEDYRAVDEKLLVELGRNPTLEEMAQGLHMTVEETAAVAEVLENAKMMQQAKTPQKETLPEEEDQAVEDTAYFQMRQRIADLLSALSPEDAELLTLRYGLEGGQPMTPQQVSARMGIPAEQVINREAAALSKIRQQN